MNELKVIDLYKIDNFKNHPFKVEKDESLKELANSIKENGLLNPLTVRTKANGRYELISGHRRKMAMEMIDLKETNAYVKELTDDEATIEMVDSNMYREKILPSEKAFAYKMKMDAMKRQGKRNDLTSTTKLSKLRTNELIGNSNGECREQVRKYIRLTNLIPELLQLVDDTVLKDKRTAITMGLKPAVELSYLNIEEQKLVYTCIIYEDLTPSHGQSIEIRKLSKQKKLNFNILEDILCQKKGNQSDQISFNKSKIESALPSELLKRDKRYIEQYIIKAIHKYNDILKNKQDNIDFEQLDI